MSLPKATDNMHTTKSFILYVTFTTKIQTYTTLAKNIKQLYEYVHKYIRNISKTLGGGGGQARGARAAPRPVVLKNSLSNDLGGQVKKTQFKIVLASNVY